MNINPWGPKISLWSIKVETDGAPLIDGKLSQTHSGSSWPTGLLHVFPPVPEPLIGIGIINNWKNLHIGFLTDGVSPIQLQVAWASPHEVVLSDPQWHKVEWAQQQSIITWKCYIRHCAWVGPEGTSKLYKQVAETPLISILVASPALTQSIPMTSL